MWKRNLIFLCIISLFFSCKNIKITNHPFSYTKGLTCDALYTDGYKWRPGVDVILLGKKIGDTIIHYQITEEEVENFNDDNFKSFSEETALDTVFEVSKYQRYLDQDPLILSDSIYNLVWGNVKDQQNDFCKNGQVIWRNFILKINESDVDSIINKLNINKKIYKLIDIKVNEGEYYLKHFKVINSIKKDTFNCSVYNDNEEFYFASSIKIKN